MDSRIIMHLDMNSYFASCEQQENPQFRGKPLGVCEHLGGIIIAPSIEAKQWGIKTAMPVWEAKRLYPKIILTKTHPEIYRKYTARFLKVLSDYTDKIEKYSIDEAFVDLSKACNIIMPDKSGHLKPVDPWQEARRISLEIKQRMKTEVGDWLRCSIGIASNKLLAKIGSDFKKPDGLTIFRPEDKDKLYNILSLIDIPGIGYRMAKRLKALGIDSLAKLRDYPEIKLVAQFGIMGHHLYQSGQLQGSFKEHSFDDSEPLKSIGHMYTLPNEYRDNKYFKPVLYKLCEMVASRLRANNFYGTGISLHIHDNQDNCFGMSKKLSSLIQDGRDIYLEAIKLSLHGQGKLSINFTPYLIGITAFGLIVSHNQQPLFNIDKKRLGLAAALDKINNKYSDFTIARVPAFLAKDIIRDSVGFGRMKEFKTSHVRAKHSK